MMKLYNCASFTSEWYPCFVKFKCIQWEGIMKFSFGLMIYGRKWVGLMFHFLFVCLPNKYYISKWWLRKMAFPRIKINLAKTSRNKIENFSFSPNKKEKKEKNQKESFNNFSFVIYTLTSYILSRNILQWWVC